MPVVRVALFAFDWHPDQQGSVHSGLWSRPCDALGFASGKRPSSLPSENSRGSPAPSLCRRPGRSASLMRCASALLVAAMAASAAMAAPSASSFTPANGATSVHPLAAVAVTFDAAVTAGQAKLVQLLRKDSGHVLSTVAAASSWVTIDGATATVVFPVSHVLSGEVYVTIEAGAFVSTADESPFAGISDMSWTFAFQGEPTRVLTALRSSPAWAPCPAPPCCRNRGDNGRVPRCGAPRDASGDWQQGSIVWARGCGWPWHPAIPERASATLEGAPWVCAVRAGACLPSPLGLSGAQLSRPAVATSPVASPQCSIS